VGLLNEVSREIDLSTRESNAGIGDMADPCVFRFVVIGPIVCKLKDETLLMVLPPGSEMYFRRARATTVLQEARCEPHVISIPGFQFCS
jgi:hypothetical protein